MSIKKDGEIVGYIVSIWYYVDHPLFDGGGTHLYFNLNGVIVEEVEWWG
jgi:hypothetical protein